MSPNYEYAEDGYCPYCHRNVNTDLLFLQWLEMLNEKLPEGFICATLSFVRFRRQEHPGEALMISSKREYGLISAESFCGLVHSAKKKLFHQIRIRDRTSARVRLVTLRSVEWQEVAENLCQPVICREKSRD